MSLATVSGYTGSGESGPEPAACGEDRPDDGPEHECGREAPEGEREIAGVPQGWPHPVGRHPLRLRLPQDAIGFLLQVRQPDEALLALPLGPEVEAVDGVQPGEDAVLPDVIARAIGGKGYIYISGAFTTVQRSKCGGAGWLDNDPHFWTQPPTWGICRTDRRRGVDPGDFAQIGINRPSEAWSHRPHAPSGMPRNPRPAPKYRLAGARPRPRHCRGGGRDARSPPTFGAPSCN